jgi:hypothetical protein
MRRTIRRQTLLLRTVLVVAALAVVAPISSGCSLLGRAKKAAGPPAEPAEPIPLTVRNENFLDMNILVVVQGASRRIGMVPGNTTANFNIPRTSLSGDDLVINAVPIGGSGRATSGMLQVHEGQRVDFRVAQVLRQSVAVVR